MQAALTGPKVTMRKTIKSDELRRSAARALQYSSVFRWTEGGKSRIIKTDDGTFAYYAQEIERIVSKLVRTPNAKVFKVVPKSPHNRLGIVPTLLGEEFLRWVENSPYESIKEAFPSHARHPLIDLYWKHTRELPTPVRWRTEEDINRINRCVASMREEGGSSEFRKIRNMHVKLCTQNTASMLELINSLFARWGRLLVIRLDLGYGSVYTRSWPDGGAITFEEVYRHREKFFRYLRRTGDLDLKGYVWKLEFASRKAFHYHVLLFFCGNRHQDHLEIAKRLGKYWNDVITAGAGTYHNCNANAYPRNGLGAINYTDHQKLTYLKEDVASYLTKPDYYFRLIVEKGRTFDRSNLPQKRAEPLGRPRRIKE